MGTMPGQAVFALTVTTTRSPAEPRTLKVPLTVPSRFMVAEPPTPVPLTVAVPDGTLPPEHAQPAPLREPLAVGGLPEEGLRTTEAASALVAGITTTSSAPAMRLRTAQALIAVS